MKHLWPLLLLTSCGTYYVGRKPVDLADELVAQVPVVVKETEPAGPKPEPQAKPAVEAPLIGWDGKEIKADDRPLHGIDTGEGGHSSLLSMYMDTKEEAELLALEVRTLSDMLAKQEGVIAANDSVVAAKNAEIAGLQMDLLTSEASRADLEARLVTAQIRRLEAEKQLLLNILGVEEQAPTEDTPTPADTTLAAKD